MRNCPGIKKLLKWTVYSDNVDITNNYDFNSYCCSYDKETDTGSGMILTRTIWIRMS